MADIILNACNDNETALDSAKHIGVLLQWIERAREMGDTFDHLIKRDEKFKERCRGNGWHSVPWDESESEALVNLASLQETFIREAIKSNEAIRAASRAST